MADVNTVIDRPPTGAGGSVGISGLTEPQAREFHRVFVMSFLGFLAIAIVAHFLVWQWRPWIPGTPGYEVTAPATVGAPR